MTKAEAIQLLRRLQEPETWEPQITEDAYKALEMAIGALSNDCDLIEQPEQKTGKCEEWNRRVQR